MNADKNSKSDAAISIALANAIGLAIIPAVILIFIAPHWLIWGNDSLAAVLNSGSVTF